MDENGVIESVDKIEQQMKLGKLDNKASSSMPLS